MTLLHLDHVSFAYDQVQIFADISLKLDPGQVFCLFGPNGSGKTTLLEVILGILTPQSGKIAVADRNITELTQTARARVVSYVPQIHVRTFPYLVKELVLMGRTAYVPLWAGPSSEDIAVVDEALATVRIKHLRDRPCTQLSGGEIRLVLIARALAQKTQVMLLDEPTAHLDFRHELVVLETILSLARDQGLAILMATHAPNHPLYFANHGLPTRVALMHRKRFETVGSPSEVLHAKAMKTVFGVEAQRLDFTATSGRTFQVLAPIRTFWEDQT